jgi:predicted acetyltransferase
MSLSFLLEVGSNEGSAMSGVDAFLMVTVIPVYVLFLGLLMVGLLIAIVRDAVRKKREADEG